MREAAPTVSVSSSVVEPEAPVAAASSAGAAILQTRVSRPHSFWTGLGFDTHAGINGFGGNIAMPVALHFNLRVGGDYFAYKTSFTEEGANVNAALHLGHAKAALDWYPFRNGFRVSPQMMFAVQTHVAATVLVPSGSTITLDGSDYVSSDADPLHGSASVGTRKVAPGFTVGWGQHRLARGPPLDLPGRTGLLLHRPAEPAGSVYRLRLPAQHAPATGLPKCHQRPRLSTEFGRVHPAQPEQPELCLLLSRGVHGLRLPFLERFAMCVQKRLSRRAKVLVYAAQTIALEDKPGRMVRFLCIQHRNFARKTRTFVHSLTCFRPSL